MCVSSFLCVLSIEQFVLIYTVCELFVFRGESVVPRLTILTHCSTVSAVTFLVCSESCMLSFSQLKMLLIGIRYTFDS